MTIKPKITKYTEKAAKLSYSSCFATLYKRKLEIIDLQSTDNSPKAQELQKGLPYTGLNPDFLTIIHRSGGE